MKIKSPFLSAVLLGGALAISPLAHAWEYSVSNNGNSSSFETIASAESGADYYNFFSASGHPEFGAQSNTAFLWLHENTNTGDLSLSLILDAVNDGSGGAVTAYYTGLPDGSYVSLADDGSELNKTGVHTATGNWRWIDCCTDGGVVSGLEDGEAWSIDFDVSAYSGINSWVFLSGPYNSPSNALALNAGSTITISRSAQATGIPLPGTAWFLVPGLLIARRRLSR
ncbi:MAG: hypothetical protein ACPGU7_07390 [Gammaproteobacteria bacterium]